MMTNKTNSIATCLHCSPMSIPKDYEQKAMNLAAKYVKDFSLSGLYKMNLNIVYNRVCNLIHTLLTENPEFNIDTFSNFINVNTLFYSVTDIQTLVLSYKANPEETFPFVICFFARKLSSFKRCKIAYIKGLDCEDVDEVMMIALYKTLEKYDPKHPFSFAYLDLELFAGITQLGGEMHTFVLPRNDYVNYLKFIYYIDKYTLTPENIEQFLFEMNLSDTALAETQTEFSIEPKDRKYSCKITLRKAFDYYALYSIEHLGIASAISYDEDADMVIDNTGAIIERGFGDVELDLFSKQTFSTQKEQRIFHRLTEPEGSIFTNRELTEDFDFTRYALSKMKEKIKQDLF